MSGTKTKFPHKGWVRIKGKFPYNIWKPDPEKWRFTSSILYTNSKIHLTDDVRRFPESDRLPQGPIPFDFEIERLIKKCKLN